LEDFSELGMKLATGRQKIFSELGIKLATGRQKIFSELGMKLASRLRLSMQQLMI